MPRKDRTGPNGQWELTGRGMWNCEKKTVDNETVDSRNPNLGKRNGGWCHQWRWLGNGGRNCQNWRWSRCVDV
jgi:hypothetical protein